MTPGADSPLAVRFDVALLDLDGVVYIGDDAVPGAVAGLAAARGLGMTLTFVTNNAARPAEVVAEHLSTLGVPAAPAEVVTSAQAGAALLAERLPADSRVLAVGGPGVAIALERAGLQPVRTGEPNDADVRAVLQGFGRDVAWSDLAAAAVAARNGIVWIATNPDLTLPVPGGRAPGNGALVAAVAAAAGREPDEIAGKPYPALMRASIDRTGAKRPLVVGDRLDTDIAGAASVDVPSLLVLTGVTDIATLIAAPHGMRPDFVGEDLGALARPPAGILHAAGAPVLYGTTWCLGSASARVAKGTLAVELGSEHWLTGLQCACAAAWSTSEPIDAEQVVKALEQARQAAVGMGTVES